MSSNAYEEGLKIRKAVLGEEYVNHALNNSFRIANDVFAEDGVTMAAERAT